MESRGTTSVFYKYWDEKGTQVLQNGNGSFIGTEKSGRIFYTMFKDSLMYESYFIHENGKDTIYGITTDQADYKKNGIPGFYEFLGKNIKYPRQARKDGIEGRVFVQFTVLLNGELDNVKLVKGIDEECNQEALRAVELSSGNWKPARHEGKKVISFLTVPIFFKLN